MVIVEGLNCAGKSTWINNQIFEIEDKIGIKPQHLITSWANPLRFNDEKKKILHYDQFGCSFDSYLVGCFESVAKLELYKPIFWDRSFITAYAYGSINLEQFMYLVDKFRTWNRFVFIDTKVTTCLKRFKKIYKDKTYVEKPSLEKWLQIRVKLIDAMEIASGGTFETIKGE